MQTAIAGVEQAVDEYLAERDGDVPPPLTDRKFSGTFLVRTSPTLHARLTVEADEQNVSMNQWVVQKLAGRPPISLFDSDSHVVQKPGAVHLVAGLLRRQARGRRPRRSRRG